MPPQRAIIFSDFDGTIAKIDVGDLMYDVFSDGSYVWPDADWIAGKVSSKQCYLDQCASTRAEPEELDAFLDAQELDPGFPPFVEHCRRSDYPVYVLSDGMDYYINRLFRRYGLEELPVFSNHLEVADGRLVPSFPYFADTCGRCANCKGPHVRRHAQPDNFVIYLGDGWSDPCGAQYADAIFAKGGLQKWCEQNGRAYYPLTGFEQVLKFVEQLESDGVLAGAAPGPLGDATT